MITLDKRIAASTEFVCECWGHDDATVTFYAPVTRDNEMTWIHPTCAREFQWAEIKQRATRIWRVSGSLWNPREFTLIWTDERNPIL